MDVKFINPFIESVGELFSTMLNCEAKIDKVQKSDPVVNHQELIGLIGLSGPIRGTVALIFPVTTAMAVVERFTTLPVTDIDGNVTDAISELVNIVAGGAKAKLSEGNGQLTLSIPNVIRGQGSTVLAPSWATWVEVAFDCELGSFHLRVTLGK